MQVQTIVMECPKLKKLNTERRELKSEALVMKK